MARDSQKSKFSKWESENFPREVAPSDPLTEGQVDFLIISCLGRFGLLEWAPKAGYVVETYKIKVPKYVPETFTFEFPKKYTSPFLVVREAAHAVVQLLALRESAKSPGVGIPEDHATHGPLFVSVFADLLITVLGYPAGDVLGSLHDRGLRLFNFVKFKELCPRVTIPVIGTDPSKIPERS